jgi:hypothetical protein
MWASPKTYVTANGIGLLAYVAIVFRIAHSVRAEGRDGADFGDAMNFALMAFPLLLAFVAVNVTWIVRVAAQGGAGHERHRRALGATMVTLWIVAVILVRQLV